MENLVEIRPKRHIKIIHKTNPSDTTLFMFHGLGGRINQWRYQIDYFQNAYNLVLADMLGHGESEKPNGNPGQLYNFTQLSADMLEIFDRYKTKNNIILGHSYGGAIASFVAQQNAKNVQKLVLIAPVNLAPNYPIPFFTKLPIFLLEWLRPRIEGYFVKLSFHPNSNRKLVNYELTRTKRNPMRIIKSLILGMLDMPTADFNKLTMPTLILISEHDGLVPSKNTERFYRQLPNVTFQYVENTGHMLLLEQPEKVNELIENFIQM